MIIDQKRLPLLNKLITFGFFISHIARGPSKPWTKYVHLNVKSFFAKSLQQIVNAFSHRGR